MIMCLDIAIFLFFLIFMILGTGYVACRSVTFSQYAVGSKALTTSAIASSIIALTYGASIFYSNLGLTYLLMLMGNTVAYFITGAFIPSRLYIFFNSYSIAEVMGRLYGRHVRKLVAVCGILRSTAMAALHLKLLSIAFSYFLHINELYVLIAATAIAVLMIQSGDIESLSFMYLLRSATFVILLPTLAWIIWKILLEKHHTVHVDLSLIIKDSWDLWVVFKHSPMYYVTCFIAFSIPILGPAEVHRILIAENALQVKRSFKYASFFSLVINLVLVWMALLLNSVFDSCNLSIIPTHLLKNYPGLQGCIMIGVAALGLSTISSSLHSAVVLAMHDLSQTLKSPKQSSVSIKYYTFIIGLISMLLALYVNYPVGLFVLAVLVFKPLVTVPLLIALLGGNLHRYAVFLGMLASLLTTSIWYYCSPNNLVASLFLSIIANLATLVLAQIVFKKYQKITHYNALINHLIEKRSYSFRELWNKYLRITLFRLKTFNIFYYLEQNFPKHHTLYVLFSFYILITNYCSFYTFSSHPEVAFRLESMVLFPSLLTAAFFLNYSSVVSGRYLTRFAALMWQVSNFYFLMLVGTGMLILSKFAHLQAIIFMVNLALSILTTSYIILFIRIICTAIILVIVLPNLDQSLTIIDTFFNINISFTYVILMSFIFIGGVLYYKENLRKLFLTIQELKAEQKDQTIRQSFRKRQVEALSYESVYVINQLFHQIFKSMNRTETNLTQLIQEQSHRLSKYFSSLFSCLKHNLYLTLNLVNIEQLLQDCLESMPIKNMYDYPYVVMNTDNLYIQCDEEQIKKLLINSLTTCRLAQAMEGHGAKKDIYIYVSDTYLGYRLTLLQGEMQKVPAISVVVTTDDQRPMLDSVYKVTEMANFQLLNEDEKVKSKIPNIENQYIINSHYGYSEIIQTNEITTYLYIIPINLQHIIKTFTNFSPAVHTQYVELDAISIAEEASFLDKVKEKKCMDVDAIQNILQLIKTYYTSQRRKTGELFYLHPVAVASILLDITDQLDLIIAALTHDIVDNTPLTQAGLSTIVGNNITQMILIAKSLEEGLPHQRSECIDYIHGIINDKKTDAILLRLADVLHNARTIYGHSTEKQIQKAKLILYFYHPLAEQMHLPDIASELHLHASKVLE